MIQTGKVIEAKGDALKVCFQRPEMCAHCKMCSAGQKEDGTVVTIVALRGSARKGDTVDVDLPDRQLLRYTAAAYLIPLAFLLLGLLLSTLLRLTEVYQAAAALILLGIGLLIVFFYDKHLIKKKNALPTLVKVYPAEETPDDSPSSRA